MYMKESMFFCFFIERMKSRGVRNAIVINVLDSANQLLKLNVAVCSFYTTKPFVEAMYLSILRASIGKYFFQIGFLKHDMAIILEKVYSEFKSVVYFQWDGFCWAIPAEDLQHVLHVHDQSR